MVCCELVRRNCPADICWSGWLCLRADGQLMLQAGQGLCLWSSVSFGVKQVFSGAFEAAMRGCAWGVMEGVYCLVVDARLCSVQRILPRSKCAQMQDEAQRRVEHCMEFGSCIVVHCVGVGWKQGGVMVV